MKRGGTTDFFGNSAFGLRRRFMRWSGLWPYDKPSITRSFRRGGIFIMYLLLLDCESFKFFTTEPSFEAYVDIATAILIGAISMTKYCCCWRKCNTLKQMFDQIKGDWHQIQDKDELTILHQLSEYGRLYGIVYIIVTISVMTIFLLAIVPPVIINALKPANESQPLAIPFQGEYFVDDQKYFWLIFAHSLVTIAGLHFLNATVDWIFITGLLHGCSMFQIVGLRLERLFDNVPGILASTQAMENWTCTFYRRLHKCVTYHWAALRFMDVMCDCYILSYLVQLLLAIVTLTILLYRVVDKLTPFNRDELVVPAIHVTGFLILMLINIYPTQVLMDTSQHNFYQAYYAKWYMAPVREQKFLVLMLQKYIRPSAFSASNLITASMEVFATIVQTATSYFSVLYAMKIQAQ